MSMMGTYCMIDREKVDGILDGELEASEVILLRRRARITMAKETCFPLRRHGMP